MPPKSCTDAEFISIFEQHGPAETARRLKVSSRSVYGRRRTLENNIGRALVSPDNRTGRVAIEHPHRATLEIQNGTVLIGSDAHYWPGDPSTAHRAFVLMCKRLKPAAVIMNGDVLDAATISKHMPIGWEKRPKLIDEIETAKERLKEIFRAVPFKTRKIWTLGNHDARFETRLAHVAQEYALIHGVHLSDHFPDWDCAWSVFINDDVVVKHRFKSGIHAPHNNTMWAGRSIITGHLHSLKVQPITDYNGTRWGVDGGCIADVDHKAFVDYTEDNPKSWRSGFVVLSFRNGRLLWPELVSVFDKKHVEFRGEVIAC